MPELVTHAAAGYVANQLRVKTLLSLTLLGSILPDIFTRIPNFVFNTLKIAGGEDWVRPLHSPVPLILVAFLLAFWFAESLRVQVFASLVLGIATHLLLDLLQRRSPVRGFQIVHERGYQWFFPFSTFDFQLGWFGPEASLYALPVTLTLVILVVFWKRRSS